MTVDDITNEIKTVAEKVDPVGHSFKFVFKEGGQIHVDGTGSETIVTHDDKDAECELHMKLTTFAKLKSGKMNPMMAVMMGKVKIKGDMSIAMKLQDFL